MSDTYAENMNRDVVESARLEEQFNLLTRNIGYLLHPKITAALPQRPKIADIGTGAGSFVIKISTTLEDALLDGFDISDSLFPRPSDLPENVHLRVLDAKQAPPEALRGQYDLVHVRLLAAAMSAADWVVVLKNALLLLKPGGAIQWTECNFAGVQHLRGSDCASITSARRLGRMFRDGLFDQFSRGWSDLPRLMHELGCQEVEEDIVSSDRLVNTRERMTLNGMVAICNWARRMAETGRLPGMTSASIDDLEKDALQEIKTGCYVRYDIHIAMAFKPSSSL